MRCGSVVACRAVHKICSNTGFNHSFLRLPLVINAPSLYSVFRYSSHKPNTKILTVPNALTALRIAATPAIVALIVKQDLIAAASLTVIAGMTDVADGYVARRFPSQQSVTGSYLDPFADKFFVVSLASSLAYTGLLPVSLLALFLTRDAFLLVGASYVRYLSLKPPRLFKNLVAPQEAVIEMKPIKSSKINTAVQITAVVSSLLFPALGINSSEVLSAIWFSAAATTLYSGLDYAYLFPKVYRDALRISQEKNS